MYEDVHFNDKVIADESGYYDHCKYYRPSHFERQEKRVDEDEEFEEEEVKRFLEKYKESIK